MRKRIAYKACNFGCECISELAVFSHNNYTYECFQLIYVLLALSQIWPGLVSFIVSVTMCLKTPSSRNNITSLSSDKSPTFCLPTVRFILNLLLGGKVIFVVHPSSTFASSMETFLPIALCLSSSSFRPSPDGPCRF